MLRKQRIENTRLLGSSLTLVLLLGLLLGLRRQLAEVTEPDAVQERLAELRKIIPPSMTVSEAYTMATTNEHLPPAGPAITMSCLSKN